MDFDAYDLDDDIYDEMFEPGGAPRPHHHSLHEAIARLSTEELTDVQERVTRSFLQEGITFTVYGDTEAEERIIPVDCLPRILSAAEWPHAAHPRSEPVSGRRVRRPADHRGRCDTGRHSRRLPAVPAGNARCYATL